MPIDIRISELAITKNLSNTLIINITYDGAIKQCIIKSPDDYKDQDQFLGIVHDFLINLVDHHGIVPETKINDETTRFLEQIKINLTSFERNIKSYIR